MTSPTIIRSPGPLDEATSAFMQAYLASSQLARQKQALQLEQQKAQSQIAMQGAEAGEAKQRTAQMQQQMEDLEAQHQGLALATGATGFLDDNQRIATMLHGQDPVVAGHAMEFIQQFRKSAADTAEATGRGQEAQARAAQLAHETDVNKAIAGITSQYTTQQLQNPTTMLELGRRVLAQTGDPEKAHSIMQALTPPEGDYEMVKAGNSMYIVDKHKGTWRNTGIVVPPTATLGSVRANAVKMAWARIADAVSGLHQLSQQHGISATAVPSAAALAEGLANVGAFGVKPFAKMGGTAAQALRTDPQQQAVSLYAQLIHNLATVAGGYRSMALMNSMGSAYVAQSGQRTPQLQNLDQERLSLLPFARAGMAGQDIDFTQLPSFSKWAKDLEDASHGGPEATDDTPVTESDLQQFTSPGQQP